MEKLHEFARYDENNIRISYYYNFNYRAHNENQNNDKSQWIISNEEILSIFGKTVEENWFSENNAHGYGLYLPTENQKFRQIGRNEQTKFFVARFIPDINDKFEYHGHPCGKQKDISKQNFGNIGLTWVQKGYISPTQLNRLNRGQLK
ncbi:MULTISPECIES: hypothetical protein [unclassified Neisseria]|uniref:hypothetical protein n=1 Tax=unclassified Neisseria TaxID=2623750 RepID=UPI0026658D10|nr:MULTISPECIES: hypothetical protein [unclassified Neisseria]MDO1515509.1 hypothetical protein [Neisseria sp. MVDL18-041461]MDO1562868.1 hypothetical protein [Neisseria sp. MVDL20-010259]